MDGVNYTQCSSCDDKFKYVGSSTTNMVRHTKKKHQNELDKLQDTGLVKDTPKITLFVTRTAEWKRNGRNTVEWERNIVKFVVATNQPLSVVENPHFRELLPKEFMAPCRKTFTNVCLETYYQETKEKLLYDEVMVSSMD